MENIKINHDLKNFQRRKSHIILLYKFIQIKKVENLFYKKIYFIFINLVEFCYLFSYDAKKIILNTWEKFLKIWVELLPKGDMGQAGGLSPTAPSDHEPKNSDAFETKPSSQSHAFFVLRDFLLDFVRKKVETPFPL